jgi:hypothetical protein
LRLFSKGMSPIKCAVLIPNPRLGRLPLHARDPERGRYLRTADGRIGKLLDNAFMFVAEPAFEQPCASMWLRAEGSRPYKGVVNIDEDLCDPASFACILFQRYTLIPNRKPG